ncbi:hypothetical protein [Butyricimonas paravirosa]|nr:hypothetical protein [Butyricimonas paravirosa]MCQ4873425.1 hypothetical protein [Butyricimonas paravirosa]
MVRSASQRPVTYTALFGTKLVPWMPDERRFETASSSLGRRPD